jgi:C-terminal processing protease CtpA/Prc
LAKATGIVFDLRGYPRVTSAWLSYISQTPLESANHDIPLIDGPGHMEFTRSRWTVPLRAPYLEATKVFLTDGSAISYAETTMGIIEHYKLGEILGGTTAGTNGNINPFQLPGGYSIRWTGMKVTKHDSTRHHGVGIKPTIPVARTQAGVATGRDEVLERGIAMFRLKP